MSWQGHIDNLLKSNNLCEAAIGGLDGSIWATSAGAKPTAQQITQLANRAQNPGTDTSKIEVGNQKFMFLRDGPTPASLMGKQGNSGVVVAKAKTCIVIGIYNDKMQPGNASNETLKYRDYLENSGY